MKTQSQCILWWQRGRTCPFVCLKEEEQAGSHGHEDDKDQTDSTCLPDGSHLGCFFLSFSFLVHFFLLS